METFKADELLSLIRGLIDQIAIGKTTEDTLRPEWRKLVVESLTKLEAACERLGLRLASLQIKRMLPALTLPTKGEAVALDRFTRQITTIIEDEMSLRLFFFLPEERARDYTKPNQFGDQVSAAFPRAISDIEESSKCYALGRWTAAVFHLMRVMEVGLRGLAASLKDPRLDPRRNPSWDSILKKCDEELEKPLAQRSLEWQSDEPFFSTAAANLRSVKDAWRNPTMHVDQTYTDEIAFGVIHAVRGSMRHLAGKLNDQPYQHQSNLAAFVGVSFDTAFRTFIFSFGEL